MQSEPEARLRSLVAAARQCMRGKEFKQTSGRVRELPDIRTVRYYTTIGLLDSPSRFDGRRAMYGLKHLYQILAVKRMQSDGVPLSVITHMLKGAKMQKLTRISQIPKPVALKSLEESLKISELHKRILVQINPKDKPAKDKTVVSIRAAKGVYVTIDSGLSGNPKEIKNALQRLSNNLEKYI